MSEVESDDEEIDELLALREQLASLKAVLGDAYCQVRVHGPGLDCIGQLFCVLNEFSIHSTKHLSPWSRSRAGPTSQAWTVARRPNPSTRRPSTGRVRAHLTHLRMMRAKLQFPVTLVRLRAIPA